MPPKPSYSDNKCTEPLCNDHFHNGHSYGNNRVEETSIEVIEMNSILKVKCETKAKVLDITTKLLKLLTIGETDANGVFVVECGKHFLESILRRFKMEFFKRWNIEFFFPTIKCWPKKHVIKYIKRIIVLVQEKLIKEYEKKIIIIMEEHWCEMESCERHYREIYLAAIRKAWEAYEKSMQNIEFVKCGAVRCRRVGGRL